MLQQCHINAYTVQATATRHMVIVIKPGAQYVLFAYYIIEWTMIDKCLTALDDNSVNTITQIRVCWLGYFSQSQGSWAGCLVWCDKSVEGWLWSSELQASCVNPIRWGNLKISYWLILVMWFDQYKCIQKSLIATGISAKICPILQS